jgi:hypothetical protein
MRNEETIMKKSFTVALAGAVLCIPTVGMANHTFTSQVFTSEESCEEARAAERRRQSEDLRGRERGMFNQAFNQRYMCEQTAGMSTSTTTDDRFMIMDQRDS